MAEEVIGEWSNALQLAIDILLRSHSNVPTRIRTASGVKIPDDADMGDAWEKRSYSLVDSDGHEISFPIKLISDTDVIPPP